MQNINATFRLLGTKPHNRRRANKNKDNENLFENMEKSRTVPEKIVSKFVPTNLI